MVVCGAGTGGTIAGIGRKFKEKVPKCEVSEGKTHMEDNVSCSLQLILSTLHDNQFIIFPLLSLPLHTHLQRLLVLILSALSLPVLQS